MFLYWKQSHIESFMVLFPWNRVTCIFGSANRSKISCKSCIIMFWLAFHAFANNNICTCRVWTKQISVNLLIFVILNCYSLFKLHVHVFLAHLCAFISRWVCTRIVPSLKIIILTLIILMTHVHLDTVQKECFVLIFT